ncbi:porin [Burkholderiaceae bacterium DAT-1]|nr:porin [Burkholderiaceae bacterium DAT-1]
MKKHLIAVAVLGALAAPAFAADNTVTLYGHIDAGVEAFDNGAITTTRVESYKSRFGIKGTEELGDGLKALFQVEQQVDVDQGGNTLGTRNTFVGLGGDFGTVLLGRYDTPFKVVGGSLDVSGNNNANISENFVNNGGGALTQGLTAAQANFHTRYTSSVQYWSPVMSGFQFKAAFAPDEAKSNTKNARQLSLAGEYNANGLYAGLGYETRPDSLVAGAGVQGIKGAVGYTIDSTTVGVIYSKFDTDGYATTAATKRRVMAFTVAQKLSDSLNLRAAFVRANETADNKDDGARGLSAELAYNLTKRTALFAYYTRIQNGAAGKYTFLESKSDLALDPKTAKAMGGLTPSIFSVGVRHDF